MTEEQARILAVCIKTQNNQLDITSRSAHRRIRDMSEHQIAHHFASMTDKGYLTKLTRTEDGYIHRVTPKGYEAAGQKAPLWVA